MYRIMWLTSIPPTYFFICIFFSGTSFFVLPGLNLIRPPYSWSGFLFILLGVWINYHTVHLFRKYNTSHKYEKSTRVIREGLYKYSRNPMYLGMLLILTGICVCLGNIVSFISPVIFYLAIVIKFIPYEEKKMENDIGDAYLEYKNQVKRWI